MAARRAVRARQGRRGHRRALRHPAFARQLASRHVGAALGGARRLAPALGRRRGGARAPAGGAAWRRPPAAVAAGRAPGREVLGGALVLVGGLLLIIPGFISDVFGLIALLPPTRALLRRLLARNLQSRVVVGATRFTRARTPYDVDSTATDLDQPQLPG